MNNRILGSVTLALAFVFAMPQAGAAATTGTGKVGDHYSEAHCNFVPATTDFFSGKLTPRQDYISVWAAMLASPIVLPSGVVNIGGGDGNGHNQVVMVHAVLYKFDPATRVWVMQPDRSPLWETTVSDSWWNSVESSWTNISVAPDLNPYSYRYTRFAISTPGDYAVRMQFWWIADSLAPSGYDLRWTDSYIDDQWMNPPTGYCHFEDHTPTTVVIGG